MAYAQMHFQGMGSFNWFRIVAWNPVRRLIALRWLDKLIKTVASYDYAENSAIMFIGDGRAVHRNLTMKTPWKCWKEGTKVFYDLSTWNRTYWKLFKKFLKKHKKYHLHFVPILLMREDYIKDVFTYNVNNVHGFWDPGAWKYIRKYVLKVMRCYRKVYGPNYKPRVIIANEMSHGGNPEKFHDIMYFHLDIKNLLVPEFTSLKHIWVDLTKCEGAGGELREDHPCPYPGASNCRGGRHGAPGQDRLFLGIKHKFTTLADFMLVLSNGKTKLQNMIDSVNHWREYTEDGGGEVEDGNYIIQRTVDGHTHTIYLGDAEQQYEMMKVLCQTYLDHGFLAKFGTFPHEALFWNQDKRLWIPDYRVKNIDWSRPAALQRACQEVLGEN